MTNEKFFGRAFTVIIFLFIFSHSILGTLVKKRKKKKVWNDSTSCAIAVAGERCFCPAWYSKELPWHRHTVIGMADEGFSMLDVQNKEGCHCTSLDLWVWVTAGMQFLSCCKCSQIQLLHLCLGNIDAAAQVPGYSIQLTTVPVLSADETLPSAACSFPLTLSNLKAMIITFFLFC